MTKKVQVVDDFPSTCSITIGWEDLWISGAIWMRFTAVKTWGLPHVAHWFQLVWKGCGHLGASNSCVKSPMNKSPLHCLLGTKLCKTMNSCVFPKKVTQMTPQSFHTFTSWCLPVVQSQVSIEEFLDGCSKLKGAARSIDVHALMHQCRRRQGVAVVKAPKCMEKYIWSYDYICIYIWKVMEIEFLGSKILLVGGIGWYPMVFIVGVWFSWCH